MDGARLAPHRKATNTFYGETVWPRDVLFDHRVGEVPEEAQALLAELP